MSGDGQAGECDGCLNPEHRHWETQSTETVQFCDPPCSMACLVSGGVHHTAESLRAAAVAELSDLLTHPAQTTAPAPTHPAPTDGGE